MTSAPICSVGQYSDRGVKEENQDSYGVLLPADSRLEYKGIAMVIADGVSGSEQGKLASVDAPGFVDASMGADGGDLCIPTDAFVRLVVGYRTLDELRDAWPDTVIKPRSRHILDVLFPRMTSCVWMPY